MKPARLLTPIAIAPLHALAASRYQFLRSPESYSIGRIGWAHAPLALVQGYSRSPP
jgi:hypothetical protein